jgi:hypothetical protein
MEREKNAIIALEEEDKGFEKLIDQKLKENRKDPKNDNLVIGGNEHVIILDLRLIKDIKFSFNSFSEDGQVMEIRRENKRGPGPLEEVYYKITKKE